MVQPVITWHAVVDAMNEDTDNNVMLSASIAATELPARSPAALYLAARKDLEVAGIDADAALNVLPEPWSNQEKKVDGLNRHIGDNERAVRDANPSRYWDKYSYKASSGETVSGSVYSDMASRHVIGHSIKDNIKLIDAWTSNDTEKSTLQKTMMHNGVEYDIAGTPNDRLATMRSTLTSRFNKLAENFRVMSAIHKNIKDITEHMNDRVRIDFVYNEEGDPSSGLAELKEPIRLIHLRADGVPSGVQRAYTAKSFSNLWVEQAIEKGGEKGPTYATLIDSRKIKLKLPGKGATTTEKGKIEIQGMISSGNLPLVIANIHNFIDYFDTVDDAVKAMSKKTGEMSLDDRALFSDSAVAVRNFLNAFVTPAMESVAFAQSKVNRQHAQDALTAKLKAEKDIKEAELQPTMNQRNEDKLDVSIKAIDNSFKTSDGRTFVATPAGKAVRSAKRKAN
jgi:hypothetical protein